MCYTISLWFYFAFPWWLMILRTFSWLGTHLFFVKCVQRLCLFLNWVVCCRFVVRYYFWTHALCQRCGLRIFSLCAARKFYILVVCFNEQNCQWSPVHTFLWSVRLLFWPTWSQRHCLRKLTVLAFTYDSWIYLKLIFVYEVWGRSQYSFSPAMGF